MIEEFPAIALKIDKESFTCYDLVKCMFHLSDIEITILRKMEERDALTAQEAAEIINRDRATAYRALEKLVSIGLAYKERRGREGRGFSNYYTKIAKKEMLKKAEKNLDTCYNAIKTALMNAETEN